MNPGDFNSPASKRSQIDSSSSKDLRQQHCVIHRPVSVDFSDNGMFLYDIYCLMLLELFSLLAWQP
jgi:hypothetical protein